MVVGDEDRPAAGGCRPGDGDVAAEIHEDRGAGRARRCSGGAVGGERLRGRTEVDDDAGGDAYATELVVDLDPAPAGRGDELEARRRAAGDDDAEVRVPTEGAEGCAHGRVDGAAGCLGGGDPCPERLAQETARRHPLPSALREPGDLRVGAEAAACAVDRVELAFEDLDRARQRTRVERRHLGGGAEGGERCRGGIHASSLPTRREPPVNAACECAVSSRAAWARAARARARCPPLPGTRRPRAGEPPSPGRW